MLLGSAALAALISVLAGFYIQRLAAVLTPTVAGVTIVLLGAALVLSALRNGIGAWQSAAQTEAFGWTVLLQALVVVGVIAACLRTGNAWWRLSAVFVALVAGTAVAALTAGVEAPVGVSGLLPPRWLPYPLGVDLWVFLLLLPIYFVTIAESVGDITATSSLSGYRTGSPEYWRQVRGGVMADGVNTLVAAVAGTFPNTTFSQNNGVIRMTGVASRHVGVLVALILVMLGILPGVAAWFRAIPPGVLHSATGVLFGLIAWTGWQLLLAQPDPARARRVLLICVLVAFGATGLPPLLASLGWPLPQGAAMLLGFPVATGALLALAIEAAALLRRAR